MTTTNPFDGKTLLARIGEYHSRHSLCGDIAEIDEYTVRSDTKKVVGLHRRRYADEGAISSERWFGADGTLQILTEYLYDRSDCLVYERTAFLKTGEQTAKKYRLSASGDRLEVVSRFGGKDGKNTVYLLDAEGRITGRFDRAAGARVDTAEQAGSIEHAERDESGRIVRYVTTDPNGTVLNLVELEYGRSIPFIHYRGFSFPGKFITEEIQSVFSYDKQGNWIRQNEKTLACDKDSCWRLSTVKSRKIGYRG